MHTIELNKISQIMQMIYQSTSKTLKQSFILPCDRQNLTNLAKNE